MTSLTKKLLIIQCNDSMRWYADKVGETVEYIREETYCFVSREPAGYINIVEKEDARVIYV